MRKKLRTVLVATAFFLTGGCGLVYESLWTRYLSELTGETALSQLIVLIVFMGGLALGAMFIGRFVDSRPGRCLFIYAILELGVGGYAILFPVLHKIGTLSYLTLGTDLESATCGLLIIKVLLSLMLIILPSVAPAMRRDKSILDIKLGGAPPSTLSTGGFQTGGDFIICCSLLAPWIFYP